MDALLDRLDRRIEWEETACPLCADRAADPIIEAADPLPGADPQLRFRAVRCRICRLCYTNPRPGPTSIGQFYPDDYSPYQYRDGAESRRLGRSEPRRNSFAAVLPPPAGGRLLDFGCGAGEMLVELRDLGWRVTGMDFSPRMVRHVRDRLGLAAVEGTLPHPDLRPGSFEAITMAQSLEHVHDPLQVLRAAHRLLTPGGKVVIAVPNIASLPFRWFGAAWHGLDMPRHLTHFEPATLARMLEAAGFHVDATHLIRHNGWLRHSARLAARRPGTSAPWCRLLRFRIASSLAGWYSTIRKQAHCILAVGVAS